MADPAPRPAGWLVVRQATAEQTVTCAAASAETCCGGSAQEIVAVCAVVVVSTGEVAAGGAGAVSSTVIVRVVAGVKLPPASTAPSSTVCRPSPMFAATTGTEIGETTSSHGRLRVKSHGSWVSPTTRPPSTRTWTARIPEPSEADARVAVALPWR